MIQNLGDILASLDCVFALASAAVSAPIPFVRPKLLAKGSGKLELNNLRHPCLEVQDDVSFIPNDCSFGEGKGMIHRVVTSCGFLLQYLNSFTLSI